MCNKRLAAIQRRVFLLPEEDVGVSFPGKEGSLDVSVSFRPFCRPSIRVHVQPIAGPRSSSLTPFVSSIGALLQTPETSSRDKNSRPPTFFITTQCRPFSSFCCSRILLCVDRGRRLARPVTPRSELAKISLGVLVDRYVEDLSLYLSLSLSLCSVPHLERDDEHRGWWSCGDLRRPLPGVAGSRRG